MHGKKNKKNINSHSNKASPTSFINKGELPNKTDQYNTTSQGSDGEKRIEQIQPKQKNKMSTTEKLQLWTLIVTAAYLIATIFIASFTKSALEETRKSNDEAVKTNKTIVDQFTI